MGLFKKKIWQNQVLVENEKEAMLISQMENLPTVDPRFDNYPVDVRLPDKLTFKQAIKKAILFSERSMYNLVYRCEK